MKKHAKGPTIPAERHETVRHEIFSLIESRELSAKEISALVGVSEKDVYAHLEHIRKTARRDFHLSISPSECRTCGFVFRKRERLKKPGKCPVCRGEVIREPLFIIKKTVP